MTAIMSDAPTAATAKASKRFVGSQTNLTVHPKARSMPDMSIVRHATAFGLCLLALGFAENLPLIALPLAVMALLIQPRGRTGRTTTGGSSGSSMPGAPTRTPCFSTGHPSLTADSSATGYHEQPEAMNLNHSTGGDAR